MTCPRPDADECCDQTPCSGCKAEAACFVTEGETVDQPARGPYVTPPGIVLGLDIWRALGHGEVADYEAAVERHGFADVWSRLWHEVGTLNALYGSSAEASALALHFEFAEDDCCDPPTYSRKCDYVQVCHECGQAWPCDTVLVAGGGTPTRPARNPGARGSKDETP